MVLLAATLTACASGGFNLTQSRDNIPPANYRADILAFLRTYLNDPTNIREAALSQPAILRVGSTPRYVACVRFNAKNSRGQYAGLIDTAAVFEAGKLSRFIDLTPDETAQDAAIRAQLREPCGQATYAPFPELQQLTRS